LSDLRYWLAFNCTRGIGSVKVRALLKQFVSLEAAWNDSLSGWAAAGLDRRAARSLKAAQSNLDLDRLVQDVAARDVRVLTWENEGYPTNLSKFPDRPHVLYVRGEMEVADEWAVAIVGTRRASAYGRSVARDLGHSLAREG